MKHASLEETLEGIELAKHKVAKKHGLGTTLVTGHRATYWEEAMRLYASMMIDQAADCCHTKAQLVNDILIKGKILKLHEQINKEQTKKHERSNNS